MKVIPVIDVLNSSAVHAVRGHRKTYGPIESVLCNSNSPTETASVFKSLGFDELYLADLDSILGKHTNFPIYEEIRDRTRLELMVDAGISDVDKASKVLNSGASKIVIGTETMGNLGFVEDAAKMFGSDRVSVSIDLMEGKIVGRLKSIRSLNPPSLAQLIRKIGISNIIILDLARVGSNRGIDEATIRKVVEKVQAEIIVGGGIRDIEDLERLGRLGVYGALVATSLHTGRITVEELKLAGFL